MVEPHHPNGRYVSVLKAGAAVGIALVLGAVGCTGKKRAFASGAVGDDTDTGAAIEQGERGSEQGDPNEDGTLAGQGTPSADPGSIPGSFLGSGDAGMSESLLPNSMAICGDACSGECTPGETECASITERIECGIDALWGDRIECPYVCLDGACAGECIPGASECVTSTRFRSCLDLGLWSESSECANACVGATCGGECKPGQTRCTSSTTVQVCDEEGQWAEATTCQNACVGEACVGECVPGSTRCSSETQLQTCNQQGQFQSSTVCQFACINGSCGGECLQNGDCTSGPPGTVGTCANNTCGYACNIQGGFKDCGNNRCIPQNECCANCTGCTACTGGVCQPVCSAGQICQNNTTCVFPTVGLGQACNQQAQNCQPGQLCGPGGTCQCSGTNDDRCGNQCVNLLTDAANCGACGTNCGDFPCVNGACNCGDQRTFIAGRCRLLDFTDCNTNNPGECASNACVEFFLDLDGDGYGRGEPDGIGQCGDISLPQPSGGNLVRLSGDCCDLMIDGASGVHPDATTPVIVPQACQAAGVPADGFNCP